jgi:CHAT domain-containing protein/Tfp pilus assembly protein PilF
MWNGRLRVNRPGLASILMSPENPRLATLFLLLFLPAVSVSGQTLLHESVIPCAAAELKPGLVVESVAKNSEGEKAGLAEGDVILSWSRGNLSGQIDSPFDLAEIETEQEPRGEVTLQGTRGGRKQAWVIGAGEWGIRARPDLAGSLLAIYLDGQALATAGKLSDSAERWRSAAVEGQKYQCSWLSPWLLFHTAEAFANSQQWKDSGVFYQEAIRQAAEASPEVKARLLQRLARAFEKQNDSANADKYQQEALKEIRRARPETLAVAASLTGLGNSARVRHDLIKAEDYYRQGLAINEKLAPGSLAVAMSFDSLGRLALDRSDLEKADQYHRQSLEIRKRLTPGSLAVATSLNNLGNVAKARGDLDKAEEYYLGGLEIRQKLAPGSLEVATSLNNLGNITLDRGDLAKTEEYYYKALEIREELAPGSSDVAASLNNLGLDLGLRGDSAKSGEYLRQALAIDEKIAPGSADVATDLNNIGSTFYARGDLTKAEEYHRRALEIDERVEPGSLAVAGDLDNLGDVADDRGDLAKAEQYHLQSLEILKKIAPGGLDEALSLGNLGEVARNRGDLAEAEEYHRQALAIYEKLVPGSLNFASGLNYLGVIVRDRGDPAAAEKYFTQSLAIYEKLSSGNLSVADCLNNLGTVAASRGDLAKAGEYYGRALEIGKKNAPESPAYAESVAGLAGVLRDQQQPEQAAGLYAQAIDLFENQLARFGGSSDARAGFRAKHAGYYSAYADLLLTQKQPELAFQVLERSRARTLLETLTEAHVDIRQGADPSLLEREQTLQRTLAAKSNRKINLLEGKHTAEQVAAVSKEIDELLSQYHEVEGQIRSRNPNYAALTQPQPLSAKEVQQQLLDTDTVLLEYTLGEKRSFVFVVTPASLDSYELPKRSEIEDTAHHVYDLLTSRNRWIEGETSSQRAERLAEGEAEYRKASATLSRMILGPVAARLEGKRLLIVADGALQYIPFAVLPAPAGAPGQPAMSLVAGHEIVNLPSASVLGLLRHQANGRGAALREVAVLADPVFDKNDARVGKPATRQPSTESSQEKTVPSVSEQLFPEQLTRSLGDVGMGTRQGGAALPRLAFSRREADAIVALTNSGSSLEALDFRANRQTALNKDLSQYRIVHFATHGLLDNEHPELSGLVLSMVDPEGRPQDGFLDLEDVYNLKLSADLVVLSACETGLGKQITGEGLVGLTRGFMYAGASRVVASLWKVDDVATADLMGRFYRGMLKEGLRPAAALRQAQIEMQKQKRWADPYYWAAFTMQGEWK